MKVLMRLDRFGDILDGDTVEKRSEELFYSVKNIFNEVSYRPDAYLIDEHEDCIFGMDAPAQLLEVATRWNADIQEAFQNTLDHLLEEAKELGAFPLDNGTTYLHRKAALALDNQFYEYGDWAACLGEEQYYFNTLVSQEELLEIQMHPENYALISVYPK